MGSKATRPRQTKLYPGHHGGLWAPAAAASDEPMEPMIAKGNADNTVKAQANHLKIGNQFLEHAGAVNEGLSARLGVDFMKVPETEAMTEYFWGMLATYLATVYVSPPGTTNANQHLGSGTAEIYFNGLLNMTRERLRLSTLPQTKVCARARTMACACSCSCTTSPRACACARVCAYTRPSF